MMRTRGHDALDRWFKANPKRTQEGLAAAAGCKQPSVHDWCQVKGRPAAGPRRRKVSRIIGCKVSDWETPAERELREKLIGGAEAPVS